MQIFSHTITNPRDNINKDRFIIKTEEKWFTICDGVSSKGLAGAKAAQIAIDNVKNTKISSLIDKTSIENFLKNTGDKIRKINGATTFTSIFLKEDKEKAILFHTGDSECYFIYDNLEIKEWTIPTTLAYSHYKAGTLSKENIKNTPGFSNYLLECLGGKKCDPQISQISTKNLKYIILCTDGVNVVSPENMVNIIKNFEAHNPAKLIAEKAQELESTDDITCLVIKL